MDQGYLQNLMSGMNPEELGRFNENMATAEQLKEREEIVRKQCDEMDEKQK